MAKKIKVGIIGGTGLEQNDGNLKDVKVVKVEPTPYGEASDGQVLSGLIEGVPVYLLKRHGSQHNINPTNVNYRANLWTFKQLGCTHVLVTTACGSLKEEIAPGDFAVVDQYIDRTSKRASSFYTVSHIPQGKPFDGHMQNFITESCKELNFKCHPRVTTVTIEGPRFSTLAESKLYKSWGCDIVNMTTVPEAQLCAELGMAYGAIALVTDYDCWHESDESVSVDLVERRMQELGHKVKKVLQLVVTKMGTHDWGKALEQKQLEASSAIMCK